MKVVDKFALSLCLMLIFPVGSNALDNMPQGNSSESHRMVLSANESSQENVPADQPAKAAPIPGPSASSGQPLLLGVQEFIKLVKEKNERITLQRLEWDVSKDAIKGERAIFEPSFVGSAAHEQNRQRNTVEELIARSSTVLGPSEIFQERNNDYNAAIESMLHPGTRLRLGYDLRDISNNLSDPVAPGLSQYQTFMGITLEQPILKNAGIKTNTSKIRIAEKDADISFQSYRQELMEEVFQAASAYWDLYLAQEKYKVRQNSVRLAGELLKNNQEWVKVGRMAETEVLEAEAGLALRKSLSRAAEQGVVSAMNRVRTFYSSSAAEDKVPVRATDVPIMEKVVAVFESSLKRAFELRPEYISTREKIEREGIRIAFAKNQRWPQLDLKGSYGLNGLKSSADESFHDATSGDFPSYTIGLELKIPIGGGWKSQSDLRIAEKRKEQVLHELKAIEVALANATETAVKNIYSSREQAEYHEKGVVLRQRLLDVEVARFEAGRSDSRRLLEREGDLLLSKEAVLESLVNLEKASLELERQEGSILLNHGIEVMEVEK
jgi:outer membrane protein TolC